MLLGRSRHHQQPAGRIESNFELMLPGRFPPPSLRDVQVIDHITDHVYWRASNSKYFDGPRIPFRLGLVEYGNDLLYGVESVAISRYHQRIESLVVHDHCFVFRSRTAATVKHPDVAVGQLPHHVRYIIDDVTGIGVLKWEEPYFEMFSGCW